MKKEMKKQLLKKKNKTQADVVDKVVANSLGSWTAFEFRTSWIIGTIFFLVSFPKQEDGPFNCTARFQLSVILKLKKPLAGWGSAALL